MSSSDDFSQTRVHEETSALLTGLRVLQVLPALDSGGVERGTVDIARALNKAGARAFVVSSGGRLSSVLEEMGTTVETLPVHSKNPFVMILNIWRLKKIIRKHDINVVHARSRAPAWSAFFAARLADVPFVTTYHGTYNGKSRIKRFYNSVMARSDVVIANSSFIAEHIGERYPAAKERVVTIPRGVDLAVFDPENVSEERIAHFRKACRLSARDQRLIVLLPGRLTAWKGHDVLLDAMIALQKNPPADLPAFVCVFLGDSQGRHFKVLLAQRLTTEGLQSQVRIAGHYDDMPAAYAGSDIVISPSIEPEAFGRVAIEAQAMRKPVIATDHGGARETVITVNDEAHPAQDSQATGLRIQPGDAEAVAQALYAFLCMGAEARDRMGARGRAHIGEHFSLANMCSQTLAAYIWVLRKKETQA